ncbi:MAG: PfkB family carbohydrate kinase [Lachnospiraceae bacterium]
MAQSEIQFGKNIMLINDLPGYGKVALAAMVPLLTQMGHYPYQLPTAIISNTLDFGKFCIQDMTGYMSDTMKVWDELGFRADCICTGFVTSIQQVKLIGNYIKQKKQEQNPLVIVDPIMADGGKLYNGIDSDRITAMRELATYADVMLPNITEAAFLAGRSQGIEAGSRAEIRDLVDELHQLSGRSVVITSAVETGSDTHMVSGYDHRNQQYFDIPYEHLPVRIAGSGDIFSAILTGSLLNGRSLADSVERAVRILNHLIKEDQSNLDGYKGIPVERYWKIIDEV